MWVKYDNFARHHSHSNALQPLPWCWKRPKLGPNICSFRLSGFRRSHPPTLVPPATCVHSWPKKVTTSALWKRMFEVASGYVIQLCMYYHESWSIMTYQSCSIHDYSCISILSRSTSNCSVLHNYEDAHPFIVWNSPWPNGHKQQQGMPSSTDVVGRGYLNFHDLSMGPLTSSFFFLNHGWGSIPWLCISEASLFLSWQIAVWPRDAKPQSESVACIWALWVAQLLNALGMYKLGKHFGGQKQDALITLKTKTWDVKPRTWRTCP